jgi:CheY-like chemotaxis protein
MPMTEATPARILVVDDDPGMRTLLEAYLGDSGY